MLYSETVNKIDRKERINPEEGLMLLREADLLELGSLADFRFLNSVYLFFPFMA